MKKSDENIVQEASEEEVFTLEDRMRLSLNKFLKLFTWLLIIVLSILFFSGYSFMEINAIDGYLKGLDFDFPSIDDNTIFYKIENVFYGTLISVAIAVITIIWFGLRGRKIWSELEDLQQQKIRQSYFLIFETNVPKGDTPTERIFYMINKVFPEVKEAIKKAEKKPKKFQYETDKKIEGAVYDLKQNTDEGILLVKFMEKQTFDELKDIVKKANKIAKKTKVFRLLCIGNFSNVFQDYGFEGRMDELNRKFKLDLIEEDEKGFSLGWID